MRITESMIKRIIREELEAMMGPEEFDSGNPSHASAMRRHFKRLEKGGDEPEQQPSGLPRFPGDEDEEGDYLSGLHRDWEKLNRRARGLDESVGSGNPEGDFHDFMEDQAGKGLADAVIEMGKEMCAEWAEEADDSQDSRPDANELYYRVDSKDIDISNAIDAMDGDEWHRLADAFLEEACDDAWKEEMSGDDEPPFKWNDFVPPRGSRY